ncbi:MAG: nickel pincer cofactor biosynthesis protein LarC, partial [Bryobacteraceae bacterium]
ISGDMTVGALIDAGASSAKLIEALNALGTGAKFSVEKTKRGGIAASKFRVEIDGASRAHRHLSNILALIGDAPISERAKKNACAVFQKLGEAEARVHGIAIEKVHFHEVGAADSIADIVGACVALDLLDIGEIHASAINVGSGTVKTEHGILPVPAPATAALLESKPVYSSGPVFELTTPTGAALVSTLAASFGAMPPMRIASIGYGAGDRDFPGQPNVLRAMVGEASGATEATTVSVLEANIDDSTPQVLGHALERLMESGALDATLSPLQMKKNRPGALLRVIARQEDREKLAQMIFAETTTLGLRIHTAERRIVERRILNVETQFGSVRIKISENGGFAPEYDDCHAIAARTGTPLPRVISAANEAYLKSQR